MLVRPSELSRLKEEGSDVLEVADDAVLSKDEHFVDFMRTVNDTILRQQIVALLKLSKFILDLDLIDERQMTICEEAL